MEQLLAVPQSVATPQNFGGGKNIRCKWAMPCTKKVICIYFSLVACSSMTLIGITLGAIDVDRYNAGLYFALVAIVGFTLSLAFCILNPEANAYSIQFRKYCENTFGRNTVQQDAPAGQARTTVPSPSPAIAGTTDSMRKISISESEIPHLKNNLLDSAIGTDYSIHSTWRVCNKNLFELPHLQKFATQSEQDIAESHAGTGTAKCLFMPNAITIPDIGSIGIMQIPMSDDEDNDLVTFSLLRSTSADH